MEFGGFLRSFLVPWVQAAKWGLVEEFLRWFCLGLGNGFGGFLSFQEVFAGVWQVFAGLWWIR